MFIILLLFKNGLIVVIEFIILYLEYKAIIFLLLLQFSLRVSGGKSDARFNKFFLPASN